MVTAVPEKYSAITGAQKAAILILAIGDLHGGKVFSMLHEDEIREGIRRIGIVIAEQVDLYEALASPPGTPVSSPGMPGSEAEDVPVDGTQPSPGSDHSLIPSEPGEGRLGEDKGAGGEDQGTAAAGQAPDSDAQGADVLPFRQAGEA